MQVRAIVSKADDIEQVRIDQFIENDQREDLSTADMIRFVTGQVAKGRSLAELARATGRNRTLLTRYQGLAKAPDYVAALFADISMRRSEEHTSELQSLMRISYAVFCLKKKNNNKEIHKQKEQ